MFDAHANLAASTVTVAPVPATTGLTLTVAAGEGALFPAAPFNCTVWPGANFTVPPLASNAEIVRVTAVVGDVLTIVRAQEGTVARSIAVGWQIAETITAKSFQDIESLLPAIQSISAGTTNATGPQIVFSNGNGITFGLNGNTVTASVNNAAQSTQPVAASAANGSFLFSTLGFSNINGISFSTSAGGFIFASHNALTSQSNQAASASNGSFTFQTLGFSNANGITFGTSAGGIITASVGAGVAAGSISAGTTSVALGQVVFSNSNNITFGLNGSTVTASATVASTQGSILLSAGTTSNSGSQFVFSNANNITLSLIHI